MKARLAEEERMAREAERKQEQQFRKMNQQSEDHFSSQVQGDHSNMGVCFWYLEKVTCTVYSSVNQTSHFLQVTRKTWQSLTSHYSVRENVQKMSVRDQYPLRPVEGVCPD